MLNISSFTFCENIQPEITQRGVKQKIINPIQILAPVAIPGNYTFAIAFSVTGFDIEKENTMRIVFESNAGDVLVDTQEIKLQMPPKQADANAPVAMQMTFDFRNIVIKETGIHIAKIFANQELIEEYKIPVVKKKLEE